MKISTKGIYALEAALILCLHSSDEKHLSIREIAEFSGLSERYLEQIFTKLKKSGVVKSTRGKQGGYCLAASGHALTAGDVIRAAEGPIMPVSCLSEDEKKQPECSRTAICPTRPIWQKMEADINSVIDNMTLARLAELFETQGYAQWTDYVL